ncbi:hypothetical protein D1007_12340 [Hordeum vulgare]|nr:hypothetical protein D1007_12340 [Hordeum vulgare]
MGGSNGGVRVATVRSVAGGAVLVAGACGVRVATVRGFTGGAVLVAGARGVVAGAGAAAAWALPRFMARHEVAAAADVPCAVAHRVARVHAAEAEARRLLGRWAAVARWRRVLRSGTSGMATSVLASREL